jgi:hypothetical protein
MPVNKFLVPEPINGTCTAYFHTYHHDESELGGYPVIYTDNLDKPYQRRSSQENFIDLEINANKPVGWRSCTFTVANSISAGSYIWFGLFTEYFWSPRFDWGYKCYSDFYSSSQIPNTYPIYNVNWYEDFKLPMYFTYVSGQNYLRTLTQGVSLSDSKELSVGHKRIATQTVQANATPTRLLTIIKRIQETLQGFDFNSFLLVKIRKIQEGVNLTDTIYHLRTFIRGLVDVAGIESNVKQGWVHIRKLADTVQAAGLVFRGLLLFVRIVTGAFVRDYLLGRFHKARSEITLKSCVVREITIESKIM